MFVGHFGVALAAKRIAPRTSLGTLVAASSLIDLLWPVLLLAGVEKVRIEPGTTAVTPLDFTSYPVSHSALAVAGWAVLFGAAYALRTGYRRGAVVAAALVASHWALDVVVHRPDLPLWPGGPRMGLGLWSSLAGTLVVEGAIFVAGAVLYAAETAPRNARGRWAYVAFLAFLAASYLANLASPPPPSVNAIAVVGIIGGAVSIAWAAWIDRNRAVRAEPAPAAAR